MLRFMFAIDQNVELSGAYPIIAGTWNQPDESAEIVLLESVAASTYIDTTDGAVRFLPSYQDLISLMSQGYLLEKTGYLVSIWLADREHPEDGVVAVLVDGDERNYDPDVRLSVSQNGGLVFRETAHVIVDNEGYEAHASPGPMHPNGSRLVFFPFSLNPTSYDGEYSIELSSNTDKKTAVDRLPVTIGVTSSSIGQRDRWFMLKLIQMNE